MSHLSSNQCNIEQLLVLDKIAPNVWRTRHGDANVNGRSYGGQLLAQALMAGLNDVPASRAPTMMQFLFLQGAMPDVPIDLHVNRLQEGKRFSSRHIRGYQDNERLVLDAHVTCAVQLDAPSHTTPSTAPVSEHPEDLVQLGEVDREIIAALRLLGGYPDDDKPNIEFRIPNPHAQLSASTMNGRFRFWMRSREQLPDDHRVHAAAFAYLSDWWLNFSAIGLHLQSLGRQRVYIASLNHAIWLHHAFRADQWLHMDSVSPVSGHGRGLSIGTVHDRDGRLVATATQECLIAYRD